NVNLATWVPAVPGAHTVRIKVTIAGDEIASNDQLDASRTVNSVPFGGPDGGGYYYITDASTNPAKPTYNWLDITGVGTPLNFTSDDQNSAAIPIPSFALYGNSYTSLKVNNNGIVRLNAAGADASYYSNLAIPSSPAAPDYFLAPFWDDLGLVTGTTNIYYYNDAANSQFIIEFYQIPLYQQTTNFRTFEVVLNYSTNSIFFQYNTMPAILGSGSTVGIEGSGAAGMGTQWLYNGVPPLAEAALVNGRVIYFGTSSTSVPAIASLVSFYTLNVTPVGSGTVGKVPDQPSYAGGTSVTLTATPATGWTFTGWSGDATGSTNPLPITMDANKNITATFAINTYSLTVTATTGGTISAPASSPVTVNYGVATTITAAATTGYTFTGWTVVTGSASIASSSSLSTTATLTSGDAAVQATFVLPILTVAYVSPLGNDVTGDGSSGNPFRTIQRGVDVLADGGTVYAAAGTYTEGPQLVVNKNATIIGADKLTTIITPSANTGNSGDARGWFLVNAGFTFNLSNVTLDGTGRLVFMGILNKGNGAINNCRFMNIKYNESGPDYAGMGMSVRETPGINVNVTNCEFSGIGRIGVHYRGPGITGTFSGNTYTGKGAGLWLDYGVEAGGAPLPEGGAQIIISNNTITNCKGVAYDGSTSAGVLVTTYFGPGTRATITGCILTDNADGMAVGYDALDASVVVASNNNLGGNTNLAVNSTAPLVNASGNWFGSNSASVVASQVSASVDYTPWLNSGTDTSPSVGFQGDFSNLWVDDNSPQVGTTGRIQEGSDLVSGSTVNVAAGIYTENVTINKPLALRGAGATTTTINGGIVFASGATVNSIERFTISGGTDGISGTTSSSVIRNCVISTSSGSGIALTNSDYNLITSNTISSHPSGAGVSLIGSQQNNVTGNTISGNQLNILVGWASAGSRSARGNIIQGNTLLNPGLWSVKVTSDAPSTSVNFNVFSTATTSNKYVNNSA
ncbi:MAG: right-handed parallel beta-helix repeat-containing protein, partial [Bacteroidota bacterium]